MSLYDRFVLNVKRGQTPFWRILRGFARKLLNPTTPRLPAALRPVLRFFYELHFLVIQLVRIPLTIFYRNPLVQGRCASVGRRLRVGGMPFISGHVEIHLGDDVLLGGGLCITAGRFVENPRLVLGDRAELGWNVMISVNQEIIIEEDARVSYDCRISDSDGHPKQADLRAAHAPLALRDIRPVRICRHAWVGNGTHIMKGVTIGEGAIIGANSVVISDIPPYSLALGNPAEVLMQNYGKPAKKASPPPPSTSAG